MLQLAGLRDRLRQWRGGDVVVLRRDDVDQDAAGVGARVLDALALQVRLVVRLCGRLLPFLPDSPFFVSASKIQSFFNSCEPLRHLMAAILESSPKGTIWPEDDSSSPNRLR